MKRVAHLMTLLAACAATAPDDGLPLEAVAGESVEGQPIHYWLFGDRGPVVLFIGTIHGNETAGTPLLMEMMSYLLVRPHLHKDRRALFVPFVNPDGARRNRRGNANGADLNRDFNEFGQPETRAVNGLIRRYAPAVVVSIHQPLSLVDHDGPGAEKLAKAMSRECHLPVRRLGSRPGSMGEYVGEQLGIPIITLELPRAADRLKGWELFVYYGPALLAALAHP